MSDRSCCLHIGLHCKVLGGVASSDHNLSVKVILNDRNDNEKNGTPRQCELFGQITTLGLISQRCITG